MEDDGFTLVSKRKAARKKKFIIPFNITFEGNFEKSLRKIEDKKQKLLDNLRIFPFLLEVRKSYGKSEDNKDGTFSSVICYGLGNVSSCYNAQLQLAFLLILKENLQIDNVLAYDPLFSSNDKKLLRYFQIDLIDINESAKRKVEQKTLFYMPHCPFNLYNNLVWANLTVNNLNKVFIIGNSFVDLVRDHISISFKKQNKYIFMVEPFVVEHEFPKLKSDAFTNTKFLTFRMPLCNRDFLRTLDEPV